MPRNLSANTKLPPGLDAPDGEQRVSKVEINEDGREVVFYYKALDANGNVVDEWQSAVAYAALEEQNAEGFASARGIIKDAAYANDGGRYEGEIE